MKKLLILVITLLAGCAWTRNEVVQTGLRTNFQSARAPLEAGRCIAGNASALRWAPIGGSFPTALHDGDAAGSYEVRYQAEGGTVAVAVITPMTSGSQISIWRSPQPFRALQGGGTLEQQMARGC